MFGRFMNNYYYGKSGKGDYTPEDRPRTRMQLFWEMLHTRLSGLMRLNLIYVLPWLPTLLVIGMFYTNTITVLSYPDQVDAALLEVNAGQVQADGSVIYTAEDGASTTYTAEVIAQLQELDAIPDEQLEAETAQNIQDNLLRMLVLLIPCIFITGPFTAGAAYVTRNWARDEHAFLWADMRDAMKVNWKESLVFSGITAMIPIVVYLCWIYYRPTAEDGPLMEALLTFGQMLPVVVGAMWYLAMIFAYPMLVTYQMSVWTVLRNSFILAIARLPQNVGIRLLLALPAALGTVAAMYINYIWGPMILLIYFILLGYGLNRFIIASYTNALFDKYLNSRIEGAKVNQGLAEVEEDEDEDDEEPQELKPWENGYASRD